jgi:ribonuclease Z
VRIVFLGTGASAPTVQRNTPCLALRLPHRAEIWLFDCGEGAQQQMLKAGLPLSQVGRVFISHLHGDHLYGLPGLLASRSTLTAPRPLEVFGPAGLERFAQASLDLTDAEPSFPLTIRALEPGQLYDDGEVSVTCLPLRHRVPAFGFRVQESERPGQLDGDRLEALGVPFGPLYGRLKRGERVELPDGRVIDGATLVGPSRPGRSFAYCSDSAYCREAVELARGVDLLVHEATFAAADAELAATSGHSTTVDAALVAAEAGARRLLLTHISARYPSGGEITPADLLAEARAVFEPTDLAEDLLAIELAPHHRPGPGHQPAPPGARREPG